MNARDIGLLVVLALSACAHGASGVRHAAPARAESRAVSAPTAPAAETQRPAEALPTPDEWAKEAPNPKHKLTVLFLEDDDGREYVVLRDDATGKRVRYAPTRAKGGFGGVEKYYRDVWSPGGEYLALPRGPFDGFCIVEAKRALRTFAQQRCDDVIRVWDYRPTMEVRELGFFHEWGRWETGSAFSFKAGLHGDRWTFVYDAARGGLYDGEARRDDYLSYLRERVAQNDDRTIGENKKGRVEITESFRKP